MNCLEIRIHFAVASEWGKRYCILSDNNQSFRINQLNWIGWWHSPHNYSNKADALIRQFSIVMLLIANHNGYWIFPQFQNWLRDGAQLTELVVMSCKWRRRSKSPHSIAISLEFICNGKHLSRSVRIINNCELTWILLRFNELQFNAMG